MCQRVMFSIFGYFICLWSLFHLRWLDILQVCDSWVPPEILLHSSSLRHILGYGVKWDLIQSSTGLKALTRVVCLYLPEPLAVRVSQAWVGLPRRSLLTGVVGRITQLVAGGHVSVALPED